MFRSFALGILAAKLIIGLISIVLKLITFAFRLVFRGLRSFAKPIEGKAYVIDGDTIAIGDARIRLFGIDAPESAQEQGKISRQALVDIIGRDPVRVKPIARDPYGRTVGRVITADGTDASAEMVARGYALAYRRFSRRYTGEERRARRKNLGLWAANGVDSGAQWRRANA